MDFERGARVLNTSCMLGRPFGHVLPGGEASIAREELAKAWRSLCFQLSLALAPGVSHALYEEHLARNHCGLSPLSHFSRL